RRRVEQRGHHGARRCDDELGRAPRGPRGLVRGEPRGRRGVVSPPMAIWNPVETLPRGPMEALQLDRLPGVVARILVSVPTRAARLRAAGIADPRDIDSLADLRRLPFTTKSDLRDHYPFGLLGIPRDEVVRIHASSGTRGKPSVAAYSKNDIAVWNEV